MAISQAYIDANQASPQMQAYLASQAPAIAANASAQQQVESDNQAANPNYTPGYQDLWSNWYEAGSKYGYDSPQAQQAYQAWQNSPTPPSSNSDMNNISVSPQLELLADQETKLATDFQQSIPALSTSFMGQIANVNKNNLAQSIENNNDSYNGRGLLYSTARLGANAASQQEETAKTAEEGVEENQSLQDTAQKLNSQALNTHEAVAAEENQIAQGQAGEQQDYLNIALNNQASQNALIGQAIGGIGAAGGYAAGGLLKTGGSTPAPAPAPSSYQSLGANTNLGLGGYAGQ